MRYKILIAGCCIATSPTLKGAQTIQQALEAKGWIVSIEKTEGDL